VFTALQKQWDARVHYTSKKMGRTTFQIADPTDAALPDVNFTAGCGFRVNKADTIRFDNVDIQRKEYGLKLGQARFVAEHIVFAHLHTPLFR
jgi:hypothetical protein